MDLGSWMRPGLRGAVGLWSVEVRTHTWLSGSGREGSWWRCSAERWLLGMEAGLGGRAAAGTAGEAANPPALLGLQVADVGRLWAEDPACRWLGRCSDPCPPPEGCRRPGPSGRRAVTLPVRWSGGGLREGSAPLCGPKAGSLDFMGERSAYQRLTGAEEEPQVKGQPDSRDPVVCR